MTTNNSQFLHCCTRMDRRGQSKDAFSLAFCLTVAKSIYKSQKKKIECQKWRSSQGIWADKKIPVWLKPFVLDWVTTETSLFVTKSHLLVPCVKTQCPFCWWKPDPHTSAREQRSLAAPNPCHNLPGVHTGCRNHPGWATTSQAQGPAGHHLQSCIFSALSANFAPK